MKKILYTFLLFCVFFSCTENPGLKEQPKEKKNPKFPEGVEEAKYQRIPATGKEVKTARVDPPFWWTGMKNPTVELLIHDNNIKDYQVDIQHTGVKILNVVKVENPNYLFVELDVASAKPGKFSINLKKGNDSKEYAYELKKRIKDKSRVQGLNSSDFMYLLMPDRFANGDTLNDQVEGMRQRGIDRDNIFFRHGGDLRGVINQLDYLADMGVTALWLNPVLENDEPYESYHGYAITDFYKIDARLGTNEDYLELVEKCHEKGIKVVMDIIHNHCGLHNYLIQDLPSEDWIHQYDEYTKTTYRATTTMDPYAAEADKSLMVDGWFDAHMPDLNQKNKHVARYLTQNNIWWVEYSGQDAYRIDTYAYPDATFTSQWGKTMQEEFPTLGLFGETWVHGATVQAQFTQNNNLRGDYNSNLPGVTDFQLHYAIQEALRHKQGWTDGLSKIYYTLAKDFLYEDPYRNVVFLDNHDLTRFYSTIRKNMTKFKSGIAFLMTTRGIPMINYGTEILMEGSGGAFGEAGRKDFPGGWEGDSNNKFTKEGRNDKENEAFEFVKKLANYRKDTPALQNGKLTQFVPENDIYVYFRYDNKKTIMVIMNTERTKREVETKRYAERMQGFTKAKNVITDEVISDLSKIVVGERATVVLELQ